tara:strand:+ start:2606 stop:2797 length:192 start_codon:yes stop_codon:yes gene_type:complete
MKDYKFILFLIIASLMLYISQVSYKDFSLNKSISACVIAQMKKNSQLTADLAKDYCKKEIKKK